MTDSFLWRDGDRVVRFGRGALADAPELLGSGHALLLTERGRDLAPDVVAGAGSVHVVPDGFVEELAADLLDEIPADAELVVALGGGRVIDTAKAIAAARGVRAGAIPTTLSAAEMTWIGRLPKGFRGDAPRRHPTVVVNDPALSASQPLAELAASAANSLAHAADGAVTTRSSPVARMAAAECVRLTAAAYAGDEPDRDALALAALLGGWTIDTTWYGLHHVLSQTLVRGAGVVHGQANAVMLQHTSRALAGRAPDHALAGVPELADDLARRAGARQLRDLDVDRDLLPKLAAAAATRQELDLTPPRAPEEELLALYEAAW